MVDFQYIGVLGCGNMGGALVRALVSSGTVPAKDLFASAAYAGTFVTLVVTLRRWLGVEGIRDAFHANF